MIICVINLKMLKDLCKVFCGLCAFLWIFAVTVEAQPGSVTVQGRVSEVVALSVAPNSTQRDVNVDVVSSGGTVRMTLSGNGVDSDVIHVPLLVRSNIDFRIRARVESQTAQLMQLSVIDVRTTGRFVSPEAINSLELPKHLDPEGLAGPFLVASGPRISTGGTLQSPNNALQITLRIHVKPQSRGPWMVHLTLFND